MLLASSYNSHAQQRTCIQGPNTVEATVQFQYNGTVYIGPYPQPCVGTATVYYCLYCDSEGEWKITILKYSLTSAHEWPYCRPNGRVQWLDFYGQAREAILNDLALNHPQCALTPCDDNPTHVQRVRIDKGTCYKWYHEAYTTKYELIACDVPATCEETYDICVTYDHAGNPIINKVPIGIEAISTPDCLAESPELGEFGETWETECWNPFGCE